MTNLKDIEQRFDEEFPNVLDPDIEWGELRQVKSFYRKEFISLLEGLKETIRERVAEEAVVGDDITYLVLTLAEIDKIIEKAKVNKSIQ